MKWIIVAFVISLVALTLSIICLVRREKFSTGTDSTSTDCGDKSTVLVLDGDNIGLKPIAEELQCLIQQELAKELTKVVKYKDNINIVRPGVLGSSYHGTQPAGYYDGKLAFDNLNSVDVSPYATPQSDQFKSWVIEKAACSKNTGESTVQEQACKVRANSTACKSSVCKQANCEWIDPGNPDLGLNNACFWGSDGKCHAYDCTENNDGICTCPTCTCENGTPVGGPDGFPCQSLAEGQDLCAKCDTDYSPKLKTYQVKAGGSSVREIDTKAGGVSGFVCVKTAKAKA